MSQNVVSPVNKQIDQSDCFVCIIKPLITFLSFSGLSAIKCMCPHTNRSQNKQTIERSNFYFGLAIFYMIIFLLIIGYASYLFINCHVKLECLELVSELMFSINAFAGIAISLNFNQLRIREFKSWIKLFEDKRKFGLRRILMRKQIIKLRSSAQRGYILIIFVIAIFATLSYVISSENHDASYYLIRTGSVLSIYVQLVVIYECAIEHVFLKALNNASFTTMIQCLCDILPYDNVLLNDSKLYCKSNRRMVENISLKCKLNNLINFHSAIYGNIQLLYKYIGPSTLEWIIITIGILIINIYIVVRVTISDSYDSMDLLLEIKTYFIIIGIIYLLNIIEETKKQVSFYVTLLRNGNTPLYRRIHQNINEHNVCYLFKLHHVNSSLC